MNRFVTMITFALAVVAFSTASSAEENKPKIRPTGFTIDTGFVVANNASSTPMFGVTLNLGTFYRPWLHLSTGFSRWSSDIDRVKLGSPVSGNVRDLRMFGDLTFQPVEFQRIRPFVTAGLAAHFVNAEIAEDASLDDALSGTSYGPELGFGLAITPGRMTVVATARREFVDDINNWTMQLGVGMRWGGPRKTPSTPN